MPKTELPKLINYGAELTRSRFWQEAQLRALAAIIGSRPHTPEDFNDADYVSRLVAASFLIADRAERVHGPSVSTDIQGEKPFVAAPGVKEDDIDETDEAAVIAQCKGKS